MRLGYRPPLDAAALGGFFQRRQLAGVEQVDLDADGLGFTFARTVRLQSGGTEYRGSLVARLRSPESAPNPGFARPPEGVRENLGAARRFLMSHVSLQVDDALRPVLPQLIGRVRQLFDLDADPQLIDQSLQADFPAGSGLRVPGTLDGFELAVRAVLGQQVTVAAARTLAQRLVQAFGTPIETPHAALCWLFPDAAALAGADPDQLGAIGIVRQRQRAIRGPGQRRGQRRAHAGRQQRRARDAGATQGTAGHRRLDGAVHRDARAALAGRVSSRRRCAAQRAGRARRAAPGTRGAGARAGLATLAQLCGAARLAHLASLHGRIIIRNHRATHVFPLPGGTDAQRLGIGPAFKDHDMPTTTDRVHTEIDTSLGRMTLAATPRGLAGAWFAGQRHHPPPAALGRRDDRNPALCEARASCTNFWPAAGAAFDLPLDLDAGTPFQQSVWRALQGIAIGTTRSYQQLGAAIGKPAAARAVGAAVGRNPVGIIVPCHRVIGASGALTGYAGGLSRKAHLLALEQATTAAAAAPPDPEPRRRTGTAKSRTIPA